MSTQVITQQAQNLYSQAVGFVSNTLEQAKDVLGFYNYPQSNIQHTEPYLNDIARGNWSGLKPMQPQIKYQPVVGDLPSGWDMKMGFKLRKYDRTPFLNEIKMSRNLKKIQSNDRSSFRKDYMQDWKMRKALDRKALNSQIASFQTSSLKPVGFMDLTQSQLPFLNDVSKANWSLHHTVPLVKNQPVVGDIPAGWDMNSNVHLKKFDRTPLLGEIQHGAGLKHVETNDKSGSMMENMTDFKLKPAIDRKALNSEIQGFEGSNLQHVGSS